MKNNYVSIHNHTDYSMLDGLAKIRELVPRAKQLGMEWLGITDHGNISGGWEFYVTCMKLGINPMLGCELYFTPDFEKAKKDKSAERFHVTVLARNRAGFKTLTELVTETHKQFYYKPLADRSLFESLGKEANNLVVFSGCAGSLISSESKKSLEEGFDEAKWWKKTFPNFFMEIQAHGFSGETKLNSRLLKIGRRLGVEPVITNDPHYVHKEDAPHHDALLAIQTASDIDDPTRFRFDGRGYHLRTRKELERAFRKYRQEVVQLGLDNTLRVAEMCRITIPEWDNKTWHIPRYPKLPDKYRGDSNAYLARLARRSLARRGFEKNKRYVLRTERELASFAEIDKMADFLLITWEALRWARKQDIAVGPGRGSIVGSFVAFLLDIHELDSVKYDLLFERFLNPERPKAPDVDSDFEPEGRPKVIQHYSDLYGEDNVMRVAAFQTMKVAGVFQTLARAHGISPQDRNRLTKDLGQFSTDDEDDQEDDIDVLPEEIRNDYPDMAVQMRHLLGTKKAISRHAAGVIIFDPDDSIKELVGLQWLINKSAPGGGNWTSQYDLLSVGGMNLMKQDTLGLRTLATIKECVRMVRANHNVELDYRSWVPDEEDQDDEIYQMLAEGRTAGIFQAEGGSNTRGLREVKPTCFEDLATITALYRAGPQDAGSDKRFLKNRADNKVRVIHPSLKKILSPTWGEMIYDEQMLQILHDVAGLTWARTDDVKGAMKLKDPKMMKAIMPDVINGFIKKAGMSRQQAQDTAAMIEAQSSYLFNRNHALVYSLTTYRTARLKFLYPLEYMTALVRTVKPSSPKQKLRRMAYVAELSEYGYKILPPDVNASEAKATCGWKRTGPQDKGWFRFGLTDCSGIGDSKAEKLLAARMTDPIGFFSVEDVQESTDKGTFKVLAQVGALESVGGPKTSQRLKQEIIGYRFNDPMRKLRKKLSKKIIPPYEDKDFVRIYGEVTTSETKETRHGKAYATWTVTWSPTKTYRVQIWDTRDGIKGISRGTIVRVEGEWSSEWNNISVNDCEDIRIIREAK